MGQPRKRFKVRKSKVTNSKGKVNNYYTIAIPEQMGDKLPVETWYTPELTEDGILFRVVKPEVEKKLPNWVEENPPAG